MDIPVISFMSASNEIPNFNDSAEKILKSLYDRFELKVVTQYIESRSQRLSMLSRKQNPAADKAMETITLDELYTIQEEIAAIAVPQQMNELMDDMLCELGRLGIHVPDRKYLNYYPIAQAKAWLCVNPLQEKLKEIALMAQDSYDEFIAAGGTTALIKFRGEVVKPFGISQECRNNAVNDNEKALSDAAVLDLEELSQKAHESAKFTYAPLEQLQMLT